MTYHTAHRPSRSRRFLRGLDWKTVSAFAAFLLVLALAYGFIVGQHQLGKSTDETKELQDRITTLQDRIAMLGDRNADQTERAFAERRKLLRQQAEMLHILRNAKLVKPGSAPGRLLIIEPNGSTGSSSPSTGRQGSTQAAPSAPSAPRGGGGQGTTPPSTPKPPSAPQEPVPGAPAPTLPPLLPGPLDHTVEDLLGLPGKLLG